MIALGVIGGLLYFAACLTLAAAAAIDAPERPRRRPAHRKIRLRRTG